MVGSGNIGPLPILLVTVTPLTTVTVKVLDGDDPSLIPSFGASIRGVGRGEGKREVDRVDIIVELAPGLPFFASQLKKLNGTGIDPS